MKIVVVALCFTCVALEADWHHIGPYGGFLYASAQGLSDPSVLYTAQYNNPCRIYRSSNGGLDWAPAGPVNSYIFALAVDPTNAGTVYAGGLGSSLYKTINGGSSWTALPVDASAVYDIDVSPLDPAIVCVAGYKLVGGDYRMMVGRSTDGGGTWTITTFEDLSGYGFSVAVDPLSPGNIYVGGCINVETRLYKSTDAGVTWYNSTNNLGGFYPYSIAVHPQTTGTILVGTYYGGVYRSTNGGLSWTQTGDFPTVQSVAISRANPDLCYASSDTFLYRSTDRGITWLRCANAPSGCELRGVLADPALPQVAYTCNNVGFFKTTDQGTNWLASQNGIALASVNVISPAPSSPSTVYVEYRENGVFRTTDRGQSWVKTAFFDACGIIAGIGVHSQNPRTVYALEGAG